MGGFLKINPNIWLSIVLYSSIHVSEAGNPEWHPVLPRSGPYQNSSSTLAATSTLSSSSSTPILSSSSTTKPSTTTASHAMTSAPVWAEHLVNTSIPQSCYDGGLWLEHPEWVGNQTIPDNTCSQNGLQATASGCPIWTSCFVEVGTVQLIYFPTTSSNVTHPSTIYDALLDYTFTSPSVYAVWKTINGWNECNGGSSQLGPILTSIIQPFDITDIRSSLYYGATTSVSDGTVNTIYIWDQLTLSDLYSDCPSTEATIFQSEAASLLPSQPPVWYNGAPPAPQSYRCNPQLAIPLLATQMGYPWWRGCPLVGGFKGMPDPPVALTFATNLIPTTAQPVASTAAATPSPDPTTVAPVSVPIPDLASSTSSPAQVASTPVATQNPAAPSTSPNNEPSPQSSTNNPAPASNPPTETSQTANPAPGTTTQLQQSQPQQSQPQQSQPQQSQSQPITAVSVAVIGTQVISAIPASVNVNTNTNINSNNPTAAGTTTTPAVVILPGGTTLQPGSATTIAANDGSSNSVVVSAASASGTVPANLVISTVGAPSASTYTYPNPVTNNNAAPVANSEANINVAVPVSGAGTGTVVYMGQTLSINGPVVTISSLNAVVSYGTKGVLVQLPGGGISTVSVAPSSVSPVFVAAGGTTSTAPRASASIGQVIYEVINGVPSSYTVSSPSGPTSDSGASSTSSSGASSATSNLVSSTSSSISTASGTKTNVLKVTTGSGTTTARVATTGLPGIEIQTLSGAERIIGGRWLCVLTAFGFGVMMVMEGF